MANLRASLLITFLSSNGATAVQLVVTVILARLLSPEEIGIYSMTAVMVSMAHIFRDFGVASYLQREKELTRESVGAAFGVLIATSWTIAVAMFSVSGWVAVFFGQPGIQSVMRVLALGFVFIPFGAITNSLLTRDYRAKEQAYAYVAGTSAYAFTAVWLAYHDFGYMSMAWANLANIVATALAFVPFRPKVAPWLPRLRGWRKVVNFGAGAVLGNSLNTVNNAIPDLLLGKLSGPHDVGIMSRSISTPNMLNQLLGPTVNYAVLPYLSKTHHAGEFLSTPLARAVAYITVVMWPALAVTHIYAQPIIQFLYGDQWLECVPIVQQVCLMFAAVAPFLFNNAAYMAIGRPYLTSLPTLLDIGLKAVGVAMLYDGTLRSFAWVLVLSSLIMYPVHVYLLKRILHFQRRAFLLAQTKSLLVAAVCASVALIAHHFTLGLHAALQLLVIALIAPVVWLLSVWLVNAPFRHELEMMVTRVPFVSRLIRGH